MSSITLTYSPAWMGVLVISHPSPAPTTMPVPSISHLDHCSCLDGVHVISHLNPAPVGIPVHFISHLDHCFYLDGNPCHLSAGTLLQPGCEHLSSVTWPLLLPRCEPLSSLNSTSAPTWMHIPVIFLRDHYCHLNGSIGHVPHNHAPARMSVPFISHLDTCTTWMGVPVFSHLENCSCLDASFGHLSLKCVPAWRQVPVIFHLDHCSV